MSRVNGWLTVDSKTLSRKNAFEKQSKNSKLNNKVTSPLSPDWMQRVNGLAMKVKEEKSHTDLTRKNVFGQLTRIEPTRVILYDKAQPMKDMDPNQSTNNLFGNPKIRLANRKHFQKVR